MLDDSIGRHLSLLLLGTVCSLVCELGSHANATDAPTQLEYPELLVVPSASERLKIEAKSEISGAMLEYWHIQIPALITMSAGLMALTEEVNVNRAQPLRDAGLVATSVGAFWLGSATVMSLMYRPYAAAFKDNAKLSRKTKANRLLKERLAEEALASMSSWGHKLEWLAMASHAASSIMVISRSDDGSYAQVAGFAGLITAFTPMLTEFTWQRVYRNHQDYKKRIYGPIVQATVLVNPQDLSLLPGLQMHFAL